MLCTIPNADPLETLSNMRVLCARLEALLTLRPRFTHRDALLHRSLRLDFRKGIETWRQCASAEDYARVKSYFLDMCRVFHDLSTQARLRCAPPKIFG